MSSAASRSRRADAGGVAASPLPALPRLPDGRVDVDAAHTAMAPADLLETALGADGWTYLVPHDGLRLVDDGATTSLLTADGERELVGSDPFDALDRWCADHGVLPHAPRPTELPPFTGGLVGAFAYDLARRIERLPALAADDRQQLHLSLRVAEVVVAVPPGRHGALLLVRDLGGGDLDARAETVVARLAAARPAAPPPVPEAQQVRTSLSRPDYLAAVATVLDHIAAGDTFQVNLAQRLTARWPGDVTELYRALRSASPAPHGACLPDIGVASISPETFLRVSSGVVTARPIKGTRPRHPDPAIDAAHADDLATSTKDRAENVMVVDLERNDLGRVCVPGSIHVPRLCTVEAHPTVWHLVSEVTGRLRAEIGFGGLLRATFPCGSITGAPKVRSMGIIEALEPVRRGWYCGAVGFLGPGAASLSVAIRTATLHADGSVDHGAGGGIVADSDAVLEHDESLAKAAAFLTAVSGTVRSPGQARQA